MTATLPLSSITAPPQDTSRVAAGATLPMPPQEIPDAPAQFQQVMQRAAGSGENTPLLIPPQPDSLSLPAQPPVMTPWVQGLAFSAPATSPRSSPPNQADATEPDTATAPIPDLSSLPLWPAPPAPWPIPAMPATSLPDAAADQAPLQGSAQAQGTAAPAWPLSSASTGPEAALPAGPLIVHTAQPAEAKAWTARLAASIPSQQDSTAAQPVSRGAQPSPEATRPTAAPLPPGWTEASRLGPEAAAMRERSTAGPGPRAQEMPAWLGSALPSLTGAPPTEAQASGPRTGNGSGPHALLSALGERIETQLQRGSERTVIRLDPPMQGQIEITLHRDAGGLQVQLSASHGDVLKQLQAISDTLRQDLAGRHSGEVSVQVAQQDRRDSDSSGRQPQDDPRSQQTPGRALSEDSDDERPSGFGQRLFSTFQRSSNHLS